MNLHFLLMFNIFSIKSHNKGHVHYTRDIILLHIVLKSKYLVHSLALRQHINQFVRNNCNCSVRKYLHRSSRITLHKHVTVVSKPFTKVDQTVNL